MSYSRVYRSVEQGHPDVVVQPRAMPAETNGDDEWTATLPDSVQLGSKPPSKSVQLCHTSEPSRQPAALLSTSCTPTSTPAHLDDRRPPPRPSLRRRLRAPAAPPIVVSSTPSLSFSFSPWESSLAPSTAYARPPRSSSARSWARIGGLSRRATAGTWKYRARLFSSLVSRQPNDCRSEASKSLASDMFRPYRGHNYDCYHDLPHTEQIHRRR